MAKNERIGLLDPRLDLTRYLTADDQAELVNMWVPVVEISRGPFRLSELLPRHGAFGATIIDGLVVHELQLGDQSGIQLLGPGDLLLPGGDVLPPWLAQSDFLASAPVRLGLLDNELLLALRRCPQMAAGLYASVGDQMQRLTSQLVICQLPRVDQRVLSMMWLLAEAWGHVTPGGVRLPLNLTHETLGSLIGARRPTVTLALRKLSEEGAIVHQDGSWLLLKDPPLPATDGSTTVLPETTAATLSSWAMAPPPEDPTIAYAQIRETVRRLREQHTHNREETSAQLDRIRIARVRMRSVRDRIEQDSLRRRRLPPSS